MGVPLPILALFGSVPFGTSPEGEGKVGTGTLNLSLLNTVYPAMGILETFISFDVPVPTLPGVETVPFWTSGFALGPATSAAGRPNGLNCEMKFVPAFPVPGVVPLGRKNKNPKNAIIAMTRTIIKSIKFLFVIKLFYLKVACQ